MGKGQSTNVWSDRHVWWGTWRRGWRHRLLGLLSSLQVVHLEADQETAERPPYTHRFPLHPRAGFHVRQVDILNHLLICGSGWNRIWRMRRVVRVSTQLSGRCSVIDVSCIPSLINEEIDCKAGSGSVMTIGEMVRSFLTKLEWFSTLFPRIPVPIMKDLEVKLQEWKVGFLERQRQQQLEEGTEEDGYQEIEGGRDAERQPRNREKTRSRSRDRHRSRSKDRFRSRSKDRRRSRSRERRSRNDDRHRRSRSRERKRRSRSSERRHRRSQERSRERRRSRSRERRRERDGDDYSRALQRERERQQRERRERRSSSRERRHSRDRDRRSNRDRRRSRSSDRKKSHSVDKERRRSHSPSQGRR
ncbi:pre-mRNA-splicing factor 38B-like isoform X2 [Acanthaster planci]|uniref:Pre-mRNA-splicing factor 38B-like isoform X2 n=1 Tax=Acanthaster planci TaxID=133434 RepID=A0A8B7XX07_ACAPL|nr:pre-mRNA-splicing factor 38B-like isoform X2 [Acanthaster planci]